MTSFTNYYRSGSSRLLDGVSFLAVPGYTGMVSINYTGRSSGGATFSGVVEIQVYAAGGPPTIDGYLPFRDISSSAYYFDAVKWAVNTGITSGTTATTFSPDAACTRAQMVTFLWRAAGSPAPRSSVNPFRDINSGAYYYQAVLWGGGAGDHQWNEFHDLQSGSHHNTWPDSDVPVSECRFSSVWHRKRF